MAKLFAVSQSDLPDEPLQHILDNEVGLSNHKQQRHVGPAKLGAVKLCM